MNIFAAPIHPILARVSEASLNFEGIIQFDLDNIEKGHGITIAITGMLIVFTALLLVSVSIAILPAVLRLFSGLLPPEKPPTPTATARRTGDEGEVFAAIGLALHLHQQGPSVTD